MNKQTLREDMRRRRRAIPEAEQLCAAQAVFTHLLAFEPYRRAKSVMAYAACWGEMNLTPVMAHALKNEKALYLPRCEAPGIMTARRITGMDDLACGMYGLMEPKAECKAADPMEIDLIFVPGAAFGRDGSRIGQGGGYYDRFLEKTDALRVGICHDFALLERVPEEAHDMKMDFVITADGIMSTHDRRN